MQRIRIVKTQASSFASVQGTCAWADQIERSNVRRVAGAARQNPYHPHLVRRRQAQKDAPPAGTLHAQVPKPTWSHKRRELRKITNCDPTQCRSVDRLLPAGRCSSSAPRLPTEVDDSPRLLLIIRLCTKHRILHLWPLHHESISKRRQLEEGLSICYRAARPVQSSVEIHFALLYL